MPTANAWMNYRKHHDNASLATQSRARALTDDEDAFASALEALFAEGVHDFADVAARLNQQNVVVPGESHSQWSLDVLTSTLASINTDLDDDYARDGYGA